MSNNDSLTSGRRLTQSTLWNLLAQLFPLVVAVTCIPFIIEGAGIERFGVLALAWALIGYSGMFDLGLGRAVTKLVAEQLGSDTTDVPSIILTGITLLLIVGLAGAALFFSLTPWLVKSALNMPIDLQQDTLKAFYTIAAAVPVVSLSTGLRGVVEAHQNFRLIALVNIIMGVVTFVGPLIALAFAQTASAMILALVIARIFGAIAYAIAVFRVTKGAGRKSFSRSNAKRLVRFGSWITVSNIVGPLMDNMDRFIIGTLLSISAVAYYATAFDIISRLGAISGALTGVLFPALATALMSDRTRALELFDIGMRLMIVTLTPFALIVFVFAEPAFRIWLSADFAMQSAPVAQWLALGFLINAVSRIPYALLQAGGHPHLTALLHLFELPIFLLAIWWLATQWGIAGAAGAWALRVTLDTTLLLYFGYRLYQIPWCKLRNPIISLVTFVGLIAGSSLIEQLLFKIFYFFGAVALIVWITINWLLSHDELTKLIGITRRSPHV